MKLAALYRDVLGSYYGQTKEQVERRFLFYRFIYRPLSFPLTALAIRIGASANAVTMVNLALLVLALAALCYGERAALLVGAALFFAYFILDFVDGNIARYHGQSSFFGKLIDGMVDTLSFLVFAAAAWGNARSGYSLLGAELEILLGIAATISALLRQNYRWRLAYLRAEMGLTIMAAATPPSEQEGPARRAAPAAVWLFDNLSTSMPLILLAAAGSDLISLFVLAFFVLYAVGGNLETVVSILKNRRALHQRREH
jgi:phosphatidylglycerophosphate synthase